MTEISATAQIAASPQRVWAVLADLASYPQWNPLFRQASGPLTREQGHAETVHPASGRVVTIKVKILAAGRAPSCAGCRACRGS